MFYYKPINDLKSRKVHFKLNNFLSGINSELDNDILSPNYARCTYNFNINGGGLKDGIGIKEIVQDGGYYLSINLDKPLKIFQFTKFDYALNKRDDRLIIYTESGKIYQAFMYRPKSPGVGFAFEYKFTSSPTFINYNLNGEDVLIMSSKTDGMVVYDGQNEPRIISTAPKITSMCIHYERLFAISYEEKNTLWFSDDLDPTNWNLDLGGAGFIDIPSDFGRLLKVVSFLDYIYIFREYGITKVTAYSVQEEFKVNELFSTSGKIKEDSIVVCGDKIMFLTESGLYMFDGFNISKVYSKLDNLFLGQDNSDAKGCYFNNKYYLLCNLDFLEESVSKFNALIEIDINSGLINISKDLDILDMASMLLDNNVLYFVVAPNDADIVKMTLGELEYSGKQFSRDIKKVWETPNFDFGSSDNLKCINKISVKTLGDIKITLKSDRCEKVVEFSGSDKIQSKNIRAVGKTFSMKIESVKNGHNISKITLDGVMYGE